MKENFTNIDNEWMGKELGLTNPFEREVFAHIYAMTTHGKGCWEGAIRLLAARLYYPKSTIARAVSELVKKGLLVKEGSVYKSVPKRDKKAVTEVEPVPERDESVPNRDLAVPDRDESVPERDILPPIPPINNNIKDSMLSIQAIQGPATGLITLEKVEEEKKEDADFEKFWELFHVPRNRQHEKELCTRRWQRKTDVVRRLILDDLAESDYRDTPSPAHYLEYYRPRDPFYLQKDEINQYLSEGTDVAFVREYSNLSETHITRAVALKEAGLFGLEIVKILRAKDFHPVA